MGPFGLIWVPEGFDEPGTVNFTTVGTANFTVPRFQNSITFQVHGSGAGGTGVTGNGENQYPGGDGASATIIALGLTARGGLKTGHGQTATGGDTNTSGRNSVIIANYGNDPRSQNSGWWPGNGSIGAGGQGDWQVTTKTVQGGSGAYLTKTYARGLLIPGTVLALVIPAGGTAGPDGGGAGVRGQISVTWS